MIKLSNIKKYYGRHRAVDDVSFEVKEGEILGFLGPNGAGKSTTMKILSSFILPTAGEAWIDGMSVIKESIKTRALIGYLPESAPLYRDMRVREFLDFVAQARGLQGSDKKKRLSAAVEKTFLTEVYNQTIDTLSKGFRQRVGLAQALLHDPPVLILDEPTDGLDPNQKTLVRQLIKQISVEKTIILSTHILEEMEAVCSRALIIDQGVIVADGSTADLLKLADNYNAVRVSFADPLSPETTQLFEKLPQVAKVELQDSKASLLIYPQDKQFILEDVFRQAQQAKVTLANIEVEKPHMDLVFRSLTKQEPASDQAVGLSG